MSAIGILPLCYLAPTLDGLIVAVVHISGARRQLPGAPVGDGLVVALCHDVHLGVLGGLLCCLLAPGARYDLQATRLLGRSSVAIGMSSCSAAFTDALLTGPLVQRHSDLQGAHFDAVIGLRTLHQKS